MCFISNPGTCVYVFHANVCFSFVRYISSQVHMSTFFPFQCMSFLLLYLHLTFMFLRSPMYVFSSVISHPRYTGLHFPLLCVFSFIICPSRLCVSETFFCISHVYLFHPMCVFPFLSTYPYFFYPIFSFVISPMGTRVYLFAMWSMYLLFFCFTRFIHFLVECFHLKKFSSDQNYFIPG